MKVQVLFKWRSYGRIFQTFQWHVVTFSYDSKLFNGNVYVCVCRHITLLALYCIKNGRLIYRRIRWNKNSLLSEKASLSLLPLYFLPIAQAIIRHGTKGWTPLTYHYHALMRWNTWTYHSDMHAMIWCVVGLVGVGALRVTGMLVPVPRKVNNFFFLFFWSQ